MGIPPSRHDIQAGTFETHGSATRRITFGRPFQSAPNVLTWISGLDLHIKSGKAACSASKIDEDGFTLTVGNTHGAASWTSITWIAVAADSCYALGVYKKDSQANEDRDVQRGHCSFPAGLFRTPPKVLVAFSAFDINGSDKNPLLETSARNVTTEGFTWRVSTWCGSATHSATVQWLAVPASEESVGASLAPFQTTPLVLHIKEEPPVTCGDPSLICTPAGVWDTYSVHDWSAPAQHTAETLRYENKCSGYTLPQFALGVRKIDAWFGANLRFSAATESVTRDQFTIGVDQWAESIIYA